MGYSSSSWPDDPLDSPPTTSMALLLPSAMRVYMRRRWYLRAGAGGRAWSHAMARHASCRHDSAQACPAATRSPRPGPGPRPPHLFCMMMTAPCRTAHHRNVCTERATEGESTGRESMSMAVEIDQ